MAQWLRALTVLPEDLGLIPSTHMEAHTVTPVPGDLIPSHKYTCSENTNAQKIK